MSTISSGTTLTTALVQTGDTTGDLVIKTNNGNTTAATFTAAGNLNIPTAGARITGDFSSGVTTRVLIQSSTVNGATAFSLISNGTSTSSTFTAFGGSDPSNANGIQLNGSGTAARIVAINNGTSTAVPITFGQGNTEQVRIDTSGNVGIGTSSPGAKLDVVGNVRTTTYYNFNGNASNPSDTTAAVYDQAFVGPTISGNTIAFRAGTPTPSERMRIGSAGQIGIGGANYGTAGQVLTSGGSGSAPSWSDVSVTTAAVLAATAGASLGAVGTYSWLWTTTTGAVTAGTTIAGSNLRYAGFQTGASGDSNNSDNSLSGNGGTPSGTWRVMGRGAQTNYSVFLALRIS